MKVKRKKNLKRRERREMRTGGWESVSELKERREKGGKRKKKEVGGEDGREHCGRAWMLEGD